MSCFLLIPAIKKKKESYEIIFFLFIWMIVPMTSESVYVGVSEERDLKTGVRDIMNIAVVFIIYNIK